MVIIKFKNFIKFQLIFGFANFQKLGKFWMQKISLQDRITPKFFNEVESEILKQAFLWAFSS